MIPVWRVKLYGTVLTVLFAIYLYTRAGLTSWWDAAWVVATFIMVFMFGRWVGIRSILALEGRAVASSLRASVDRLEDTIKEMKELDSRGEEWKQ